MGYTKLGDGIWNWEPWRRLEGHDDPIGCRARMLWLCIYTSPESKRMPPGLWHGSITTMADASGMSANDVFTSLDRLLEHRLVEHDQRLRVLRLTRLPDAHESPSNGNAIRGWYSKFKTVPECAVRNAHVTVIRWLLEEWCRTTGKVLSKDHAQAWSETFGRMEIPEATIRAGQRLIESDTSTPVQTSLFSPSSRASGLGGASEPHQDRDPKEIRDSETHGRVTVVGLDQDQDQDQDLRSSSSLSGEGDPGGGHVPSRPHLTLVHGGFDADDLAEMLVIATSGRFPRALTRDERTDLQRAIGAAGECVRGDGVIAVLREHIASLTSWAGISPEMVASPGWLQTAIQQALNWKAQVDAKRAMLAAARTEAGI